MSLEFLREKQRAVFWVVAIIVIPSFILAWGGSSYMRGRSFSRPIAARVYGRKVSIDDFYNFRRRLCAATDSFGQGLVYYMPLPAADSEGNIHFALAMAHIQEAREAGIRATPLEIGTYIRQEHPLAQRAGLGPNAGEEEFRKAYRQYLDNARVTHEEFLRGVEEWLILRRYLEIGDSSFGASEDGYLTYARESAKITCQRLFVRLTEAMKDQAFEKLLGKSESHPEGDEAAIMAAIEDFLKKHENDRRFWSKAKWRFAYVLAPFAACPVTAADLKEKTLKDYFVEHPDEFEKGKKFEDVREQVLEAVLQQQRREYARRTIVEHFDPYVRACMANNKPFTLEDVGRVENLAARKIQTGDSGDTLRTVEELSQIAVIGDSQDLPPFLEQIDAMPDKAKREERVAKLKKLFDDRSEPFACKAGLFRIRLLAYQPSAPRRLRDDAGMVDSQLRLMVVDELRTVGGMEIARKIAEDYEARLREGKEEGIEGIEERTSAYMDAPEEIRDAALGDTAVLPAKEKNAEGREEQGFEVLRLRKRDIPLRADFESLPEDKKRDYLRRGRYLHRGVLLHWGTVAIRPGPLLQEKIFTALKQREIEVFAVSPHHHERAPADLPLDADY